MFYQSQEVHIEDLVERVVGIFWGAWIYDLSVVTDGIQMVWIHCFEYFSTGNLYVH